MRFEPRDGVFDERGGVALPGLVAPNDFLVAVFGFGKADDVQQFGVKALVQRVAVVGERQLEEMFGGEQLEERDQRRVVGRATVAQRGVIVAQVEMRERQIIEPRRNGRFGEFLVKKIGRRSRKPPRFELGKMRDKRRVLRERFFKDRRVEQKPFKRVGDDDMPQFKILPRDALAQIIEDEFPQRL